MHQIKENIDGHSKSAEGEIAAPCILPVGIHAQKHLEVKIKQIFKRSHQKHIFKQKIFFKKQNKAFIYH